MGSPNPLLKMEGSLLPILILSIHVVLGVPAPNNTKTDARKSGLWSLQTNTNNAGVELFVQERLRIYSLFCCKRHGRNEKKCENDQMGYWAWIPDDDGNNLNVIQRILTEKFDPSKQTKAIQDKMCGLEPYAITDQDFYPFFAFPDRTQTPHIHVETQLIERMTERAKDQNKPTKPTKTRLFLYSANSPCTAVGKNPCLQQIFLFAMVATVMNDHSLHVGFKQWFEYSEGSNLLYFTTRKQFCNVEWTTTETSYGVEYYKKIYAVPNSTKLSFIKIAAQNGDSSFEANLGSGKC